MVDFQCQKLPFSWYIIQVFVIFRGTLIIQKHRNLMKLWREFTKFTNPWVDLCHIPQCSIQNRNVYISVLNEALWDMSLRWVTVGLHTDFGINSSSKPLLMHHIHYHFNQDNRAVINFQRFHFGDILKYHCDWDYYRLWQRSSWLLSNYQKNYFHIVLVKKYIFF